MTSFTREEVAKHNDSNSCWIIRRGKVYDITKFLHNHPGGPQIIEDFAGTDVTLLMDAADPHSHSRNAYKTLMDLEIGVVEGHEQESEDDEAKEPLDWSKPMMAQVNFYLVFLIVSQFQFCSLV